MNDVIVEAANVSRAFAMPAGAVVAVRDVTLSIAQGEHTAISGPSGCGKSTLLHILGCVDTPSSGTLVFDGENVSTLNDRARSLLRLRQIGFVFQRFFLLPMLTAAENVELPQAEAGAAKSDRRRRSLELLEYVGLAQRADHRPSQLSGGEMQRVAIARALANGPRAYCSRTSPRASSTRRPANMWHRCSTASTPTARPWSSSRTTPNWPAVPGAC